MQRYIDISWYIGQWYCIDTHLGRIDISNIVIYRCIAIKMYTYTYNWCCSCTLCLWIFTPLQPFSLIISEKSSKNQLIHTWPYRAIYRCIVIHKWQYIDTPKLCIVTSLTHTHTHTHMHYTYTHTHTTHTHAHTHALHIHTHTQHTHAHTHTHGHTQIYLTFS